MNPPAPGLVDFFAGNGRVTQGANHSCVPVWFNDIKWGQVSYFNIRFSPTIQNPPLPPHGVNSGGSEVIGLDSIRR